MLRRIIFILVIIFSYSLSAQKSALPVFEKGKIVGKINENTNYNCRNCYSFQTVNIYGNEIRLKIPVSIVEIQKDKSIFQSDFKVNLNHKYKNVIEISNNYTSQNFKLYISEETDKLFLNRIEEFSNSSYHFKIAENDFVDLPATLICENILKNKIYIADFIDFTAINGQNVLNKNCFHCPLDYTIEECLKMKTKSETFLWKY